MSAVDTFGNVTPSYTGVVNLVATDPNNTNAGLALPAGTMAVLDANAQGSATIDGALTLYTVHNAVVLTADDGLGHTGILQDILVLPAEARQLSLHADSGTVPQGGTVSVTAVVSDAFGNAASNSNMQLSLATSDPQATLPAPYALDPCDAGMHTFAVVLETVSSGTTITVSSVGPPPHPPQASLTVAVTATGPYFVASWNSAGGDPAGTPLGLDVRALAQDGTPLTDYTGTIGWRSTDPCAHLPSPLTLTLADHGAATVQNIVLTRAGTQYVIMQDTNAPMSGASDAVWVTAGPASAYSVGALGPIMAGIPFDATVFAQDAYHNTDPNYAGTMAVTLSDPQGTGPQVYTFDPNDVGRVDLTFTLRTAGQQMLTFTDTQQTFAKVVTLVVAAAPPGAFAVTPDTNQVVAGSSFGGMVRVYDSFGNPTSGYTGTLRWSSNNANAWLPQNDAFLATDIGTHRFVATLYAATPNSVLTVTDSQNANITGTSPVVQVFSAGVTGLLATVDPNVSPTAGVPFAVTIQATDPYGNMDPNINDTVTLSCDENTAVLPAQVTLVQGSASAMLTLTTTPDATLTVTDLSQSTWAPATLRIPLQAGAPASLSISNVASPLVAGGNATFTLQAFDAYGNSVTQYGSSLAVTSSDPLFAPMALSVLPSPTGMQNITTSAGVTLRTAGVQTITLSDGNNLQASTSIIVTPAAASKLGLSTATNPVAGTPQSISLSALDPFSNVDPNFVGSLHFSSTDPCATFVGDANMQATDEGHLTLAHWVTFGLAGPQTLLVTDKNQTQITGLTSSITVQPGPATAFSWTGTPNSTMAGVGFSGTLQALDAYGNLATGYVGTVHMSAASTNANATNAATLPPNYTFAVGTSHDNGRHTFGAIKLDRTPSMVLIATDTSNPNITGEVVVPVTPSSTLGAIAFATQPTATTVCAPFTPDVRVQMLDIYGNTMTQNSNTIGMQGSLGTTLGGPNPVMAQNGVATFTGLYPGSMSLTSLHAVVQDAPTFVADSNIVNVGPQGAPIVDIINVSSDATCISLQATVAGTCGAQVDVRLTYDAGNGAQPTALASSSQNGLGRVRADVPLSFTWDAFANLPRQNTTAVLTLTASSALASGPTSQSTSVGVQNGTAYVNEGVFRTNGASAVQVITAGDINNDGGLDLIFADGSSVWMVTGANANATTSAAGAVPHAWVPGSTPLSLAAEDLNLDGKIDLVGCVQGTTARTMVMQLGHGDGTFGPTTALNGLPDCYDTLVTDINNDGKRDILTQNSLNSAMVWILGDGRGNFNGGGSQSVTLPWAPAAGAMVGDVTGDGNVDVLVGQASPGTGVAFIRNIGTPGRGTLTYTPGGSGFHFAQGDINRDGDTDVLVMSSAGSSLYMGITDTTLGAATTLAIPGNIALLRDMDRDGMLDLVAGVNGAAIIWRGNGAGNFTAQNTLTTTVNTGARAMYIGKIHGTSYLGLALSNGDNSVSVYFNSVPKSCVWDLQAVHLRPVAYGTLPVTGLASGDFNEDGKRDVVTSLGTSQSLLWSAGDGAGGFSLGGAFAGVGSGATFGAPIVADINQDGHLDVAAAATNQSNLAYLLGDGNGHFATPVFANTSVVPTQVLATDFNNDGVLDFVTTNSNDGSITTLYGPNYATATVRSTFSHQPGGLAAGDLNGDGQADLAVISRDTNALSIFLNVAGQLVLNRVYTSSATGVGLALADINADNNLDVVMADANARTLYVRQGSGLGTFSSSVNYSLPCTPSALTMGDFDGTGGPDAAVSCGGDWEGLLVIYNNGSGNLSYTANHTAYIPSSVAPGASVAADFSSDGYLDLATASPTGAVITLARNTGAFAISSGFFGASANKLNGSPDDVALEDINRDGMLDVLATNNSQLGVLLGNGGVTLGAEADFGVSASPAGLATGQVLHDGIADVVVGSDATSSISYFRNATPRDGNAAALSFSSTMNNLPYAPSRVILADIDHSGTLDALVASDHLQVLRASASNMGFGSPEVTDLGGLAQGIGAGDINRDGWVDVVLSITGGNTVAVMLNDGTGAFPAISSQIPVQGGPWGIALADINVDGKLDAVTLVTGGLAGEVAVLMGDGNGSFTPGPNIFPQTYQSSGQAPRNIHLQDVNGDGRADLVVPLLHSLGVVTMLGVPYSPYFDDRPMFVTAGNGALDVALGDMNRDGQPDYVVVDQVGNQVTVLPSK